MMNGKLINIKAIRLKTNYRINPIGIDEKLYHFSWNVDSGIKQKAFQLRIVDEDKKEVFNSSKIENDIMHYDLEYNFPYQKRYYWTITSWNENDEASNSDEAYFETGIKEFKAKWISTGRIYKKERLSADYFKKELLVESKIKKARLYASSLGTYSCFINDERLEGVLAPGTSEYNKHLYYQTYDITDYLNKNNKIEFVLMDGWYMGKLGYLNEINHFGNQRKLIAQLEIEYELA